MKNKQPIAIVGMACRFPGGCHNPQQYWELLHTGADVITEIRPDRWSRDFYYHPDPKSSGKTYTAAAGQLEDIYHFDAAFFGISPREAAQMDPQQRLLLQMAWEAVEDAGVLPRDLAGSHCSVYTGVSSLDYANNRMDDPNVADAYFMTGNTLSIAANRISHFFDLHGPSMTIDTACSSSLVALHQACSSIWSGESAGSIVGAVHLVLSPFPFIGFSKASMLSRLGRCSVFDAAADGYVRSEGGVVLYLKPLEQALRDNNTIHALIRGTGVNSDGNTSTMTVPNGAAQATLLQNLYAGNGIDINDIDYIEAHGTGTPVGDPIEATALGQAVGSRRPPANPLLIGSVKTNIGHLEPASGFAGLLKVVLSLKHRTLPATIHQNRPNPQIDFERLNLRVVNTNTGLPALDRPLIMGVNSFGFGGTNAHTILTEYREPVQPQSGSLAEVPALPPLFLSAMSEPSLKKRAAQFLALLAAPLTDRELYDIFHTAACRRQKMKFGLVAVGATPDVIRQALDDYLDDKKSANLFKIDPKPQGSVAWIFSGNGSQWPGMGRGLLAAPVFSDTIERIDAVFQPLAGWSLLDELRAEPVQARLELTEVAQPLLFAVQAGIVSLLQDMGVQADAVAGHSVGEIAAAYVSGSLSLEDAVRVIYFRSAAQGRTRGRGRMAAVRLSPEAARLMLESGNGNGEIEIAAFNAPDSITVSGNTAAVRALVERLQEQAITCRELDLDYAFHSAVMDDVEQYIKENLRTIAPVAGTTTFVSTVSGFALAGEKLDADYWWRNIRNPVQFGSAISDLLDRGVTTFIEIGAHPVLQSYMRETMQSRSVSGNVLRTVKRNDTDELLSVRAAALKVLFSDADSKPGRVFPLPGRLMALPAYPWDESAYLFTGSNEAINRKLEHPLLGYRLNAVDGIWINQIDVTTHPYLADHVVDGVVIFPAAGFVEMALAASRSGSGHDAGSISNIEIRKPLILEQGKTKVIQFHLSVRDMQFSIRSRDRLSDISWTEHANGRLGQGTPAAPQRSLNMQKLATNADRRVSREQVYAAAAGHGLEYGPAFQGAASVVMDDDALLTTLVLPDTIAGQNTGQYLWHPVLMDAAFHALFAHLVTADVNSTDPCPYVPVEMNDIRYYGGGPEDIAYSECRLYRVTSNLIRAAFVFYDRAGTETAAIRHCVFRKLPRHDRQKGMPSFYRYTLVPKNLIDPYAVPPLPAINEFVDSIPQMPGVDALVAEEKLQSEQVIPLLDALASALAEQTLREFGAHLGYFTIESLMTASRIPDTCQPLLARLLDMLEQDGRVIHHDNQWKLLDTDEPDDPAAIWRSILADYPACVGVLRHTLNNSFRIRQILSGGQAAGAPVETGHYLPAPSDLQQALLGHVFAHIRKTWPQSGRRLRIAEVRSGPVAVPGVCMPPLPSSFCDYEVLALSDAAALQAEESYGDYANVSVTRVELSRAALQPTYQEGEFDIVLVFGGLNHNGPVSEVLPQIAWLLASGGLLLMSEKQPDRITDLNMGAADPDGERRSRHAAQPLSGHLYAKDWAYLLENSGFDDVRNLIDILYQPASRHLFAARRSPRQMIEANKYASQSVVMLIAAADGYSFELARTLMDELAKDGIQTVMAVDQTTDSGRQDTVALDLLSGTVTEQFGRIIDPHNTLPLNILYLGALNDKSGEASSNDTADQITACNMRLLNLIKSLSEIELKSKPVVRVITAGAAGGYDNELSTESNPHQAGLWALGRVIRNEYPDIDCRMIDLQHAGSLRQSSRLLGQEIASGDGEEEVIFIDATRMVMRLDIVEPDILDNRIAGVADMSGTGGGFHLAFSRAGSIDNLEWHGNDRGLPGTEEVEIEVRAAGLNFRDIMFTSGLLPPEMLEDGHSGATLGLECAGVISRVGPSVSSFSAGDEVIAMAPACFASHVIVSKYSVIRKPAGWSFEAAATIPTAFFTVYYALNYMARLRPGERVLIHGATGGVGLAAIQYARYCGAEIFATAGSPEKRRFLKLLGVEHVLNSRTLDFADQIMSITAGEGVDVVLNSLAGEAMSKNFSVIRPFGRFIELGKRDFFENTKLDLKPFRNNITYYGVDADQLLSHEPELSRQLMTEVFGLFNDGVFRPLPYTAFRFADVKGAFRHMQQSRHIGKVVLCNRDDGLKIRMEPHTDTLELDAGGTYLVTGGPSGFGLATAEWLVRKGARHLVLASRNGSRSADAAQVIDRLTTQNVDVRIVRCDVTDAIGLQAVLNDIQQSARPLKGIIHSAMVLEDAAIRNMDADRMHSVIAPKVQGAWNLHRLTLNYDLDMFVLYSSATTCIGNPGQANYVAANSFLEALARTRRLAGLPATVVSWDAITDTGYLARNEQLAGHMTRKLGLAGITSSQALESLERLLVTGDTETIVMNANWSSLRQILPVLNSNLFRNIMHLFAADRELDSDDLVDLLAGLPHEEKQPLIVAFLIREIARILQTSEEKIAHNGTIQDIGIDSLMAMELANTIETRLGVNLPVIILADNITIDSLAFRIIELLGPQSGTPETSTTDMVGSLARIHAEEMSADEIESLSRAVNAAEQKTIRLIQ